MLSQWLFATLVIVAILISSVIVAFVIVSRRRRSSNANRTGWLTDDLIAEIMRTGTLSGRHVPEEGLDLEEIAREEERFWSETWDEPEAHWE